MEEKIVQYLCKKYSPEAIVLAGSRAQGAASADSDYDLFLLGTEHKNRGGLFSFENALLDVTLKNWPENGKPLTNPFGPLWPLKVIFDDSDGKLAQLLRSTEEAKKQGPLDLYREGCIERLGKLNRWLEKIQKYQEKPEVQFYYSGTFYEFFIRSWFEVQNLWPQPPREAVTYIREKSPNLMVLLSLYVKASGEKQSEIATEMIGVIRNLAEQKKLEVSMWS